MIIDVAKKERIDIINDKIQYWTRFGNNNTSVEIDVFDILDNLYKEKYDIIHDTHTLNLKHLYRRVDNLYKKIDNSNCIQRKKYRKELEQVKDRIIYLSHLDSLKNESVKQLLLKK